jgi:MFS transporter, OFA family, oxalate/formate antiporter
MNSPRLFGLPAEKGRWLLIPLGIIIQLCLGTAYSWSIFSKPIAKSLDVNTLMGNLPFTILLVTFSIVMPIAGAYIERFGATKIIAAGAIVMGVGYTLSGFVKSIPLLVVTYGILAGAGIGIVYGAPLAVIAKWFPDRKGLAVGATVIGFGLSPLITAPIAKELIKANGADGWQQAFQYFGIIFTAIMLLLALVMKTPPQGWLPQGWQPPVKSINSDATQDLPLLKNPAFYSLWLCFAIGSFAGLAAIGTASPVGQDLVKLDRDTAALSVSLFAIFNGIGRPCFGWIADRYTARIAAIISYVTILIGAIIMMNVTQGSNISYLLAFCLIYFAFGGWLAIAPTSTLNLFRAADYAKNYGIVFTAYGAGALLGTLSISLLKDVFKSYVPFFYITATLAILGIFLANATLKPTVKITPTNTIAE